MLLGVLVVLGPIPVGLVWAWSVHPLLVVPAYLLGIAAWLTLLSGLWSLVRRVLPSREDRVASPAEEAVADPATQQEGDDQEPTVAPVRLRMPSPRSGATVPHRVSSPTP